VLNDILTGRATNDTSLAPPPAPTAPRPQIVYEPVYVESGNENDPVLRWLLYVVVALGLGFIRYMIRTSV
jgi:hypothetical protein